MSFNNPTQTQLPTYTRQTITELLMAEPFGGSPIKSRTSFGSQGYHSSSELSGSSPPVPTPLLEPTMQNLELRSSPMSSLVEDEEWSSCVEPHTDSSDDDRFYSGCSAPANSPVKSSCEHFDPFANSRAVTLPLQEQIYGDTALRKNRFGLFDVDRAFPCTTSDPCLLDSIILKEKEEQEVLFRELSSKNKFKTRRMQLLERTTRELERSVHAHAKVNNALRGSRFIDADV